MYSRADRKFLTPNPDHANPNLGPGVYTPDNLGSNWGRVGRKPG